MPNVQIDGLRCNRCGHEWRQKTQQRPAMCPHCKRMTWDRPPVWKWKDKG